MLSLDSLLSKTGRSYSTEVVEFAQKKLSSSLLSSPLKGKEGREGGEGEEDRENWYNVAVEMGYRVTDLDYSYLAGAMIIELMKVKGATSIPHYIRVMKKRLDPDVIAFMENHQKELSALIQRFEAQDYDFSFFSAMNLLNLYMARPSYDEDPFESPSYFYMRIVVGLFFDWKEGDPSPCDALGVPTYKSNEPNALQWVSNVYEESVHRRISFASPTMFSSGFKKSQKASCFLLQVGDNLEEILGAMAKMGQISKYRGGIGADVSLIRHSNIGDVGMSSGTRNLLLMYDRLIRYVDQVGMRKGAATIYQRPHHPDVLDFSTIIDKEERGSQESAPNIDTAFWLSYLFFRRVRGDEGGKWTLFCPAKTPSLNYIYGEEFMQEYIRLENLYEEWRGRENEVKKLILEEENEEETEKYRFILGLIGFTKQIHVDDLLDKIIDMQRKWGKPYLLNGDAANFKSNQKNLGYIRNSNLCVAPETLLFTKQGEKVISSLENQKVEVWNGEEWSEVVVKCTCDEPTKLLTVKFSNGRKLKCTPEHNFYLSNGLKVTTEQLNPGVSLLPFKLPFPYSKGTEEITVDEIIDSNCYSKTYCVTEPKRHMAVFNGILTGQCTEIIEYTAKDEIATCNLGSLVLGKYVLGNDRGKGVVDAKKLGENVRMMVMVLNRVIDSNYYPVEESRNSNMKHRPIGLGVCGWGDLLNELRIPVDSEEATLLNKKVAACIYYNALVASSYLGMKQGNYSSFKGSPMQQEKLQFDLWQEEYKMLERLNLLNPKVRKWEDQLPLDPTEWGQEPIPFVATHNKGSLGGVFLPSWTELRKYTSRYMRNSLLIARMPTASSASLAGATESTEIHSSNIYTRNVLAVSAPVVNTYMVKDLKALGLWNKDTIDFIRICDGSISQLDTFVNKFPEKVEEFLRKGAEGERALKECQLLYRTIWEISQRVFIHHAATAGIYICQAHSFNIFLPDPTAKQLKACMLTSAESGLKTLNYYVRRLPASKPNPSTVDPQVAAFAMERRDKMYIGDKGGKVKIERVEVCYKDDDGCISCQS